MQTFLETTLFFWLNAVLFIAGRAADAWTARNDIYYAQDEGMPFSRNADGDFDYRKNFIASGIFLAIWIALRVFGPFVDGLDQLAPGAFLPLITLTAASFWISVLNIRGAKRMRVLQIEKLRELRDTGFANIGWLTTRNGKTYYKLFRWVFTTAPVDGGVAQLEVGRLLTELAHKPESEWFPA